MCPEQDRGAIRVRRALIVGEMRKGRPVVYQEPLARCRSCGEVIAPSRMLERVMALLGSEADAYRRVLTRYCAPCRALVGRQDGAGGERGT
ncbi:MAG: hypothetical protein C4303_09865 [candidate division GAL15 bacterium]